jgi:FkbM family methyltransferase
MRRRILNLLRPLLERFPRLLMNYRLVKDHWGLFDAPVATPLGFRLAGNASMQRGDFEPEETQLIGALLQEADVFVNVGANIGYYCCLAARIDKRVIAFEPMTVNLQYLLKNVEANGWGQRVDIVPLALSDSRGAAKMYGGGTAASLLKGWARGPEENPTLVATSTLDAEALTSVAGKRCLILIDIEGAERRMLKGAAGVLGSSPKPRWVVEISVGEHQPGGLSLNPDLFDTFQVFWSNGYEAWTTNRPYRLVSPEEVRQIVATGRDTLATHNFLFVEKGTQGCWSGGTAPAGLSPA